MNLFSPVGSGIFKIPLEINFARNSISLSRWSWISGHRVMLTIESALPISWVVDHCGVLKEGKFISMYQPSVAILLSLSYRRRSTICTAEQKSGSAPNCAVYDEVKVLTVLTRMSSLCRCDMAFMRRVATLSSGQPVGTGFQTPFGISVSRRREKGRNRVPERVSREIEILRIFSASARSPSLGCRCVNIQYFGHFA